MEIVTERQFQAVTRLLTFTLFSSAVVEVPIQGSDDETYQSQAIADIW